ncbi:MAG TPA: phosphoribosyltransferase family protein [Saprospiraceae bacterium]|nr:phosphoribosyltransferase family protein [Saprospiraceae bacterium]
MMSQLDNMVKSLSGLLYPDLCMACSREAPTQGSDFCLFCQMDLPFTNHFNLKENSLLRRFYGRLQLESGAALFYFTKDSQVQNMLHGLKYKGQSKTAIKLGRLAAKKWMESGLFSTPDFIVPVPITPKRKKKRGYNQAFVFGEGVSVEMGIPCFENILFKTNETDSQTSKTRMERLKNVQNAFSLQQSDGLKNSHILIVDDVITTGATIEACIIQLEKVENVRFSVLTAAMASD